MLITQKLSQDPSLRPCKEILCLVLIYLPFLMKTLSIVGTAAMFLVGGGILVHSIPFIHYLLEPILHSVESIKVVASIVPILLDGLVGVIAGALTLLAVTLSLKIIKKP